MNKANSLNFYVDDGSLRCRLQSGDKVVNLNRQDAKDFLKDIDNEKYEIRFKKNKIVLTNELDEISIDISKEIFNSEYKYLVRKTYKRVRQLQREYMKEKYKGKEVKKALIRGSLISTGSLAGILMAVSLTHQQPEVTQVMTEPIPIENIQPEETNQNTEENTEQNTIEPYEVSPIQDLLPKNNMEAGMVISSNADSIDPGMVLNSNTYTNNFDGMEVFNTEYDLEIEDLSQVDDVVELREKYWEDAKKAERKWGIDARVLLAMLTQESRGKEENLMQIEFDQFEDVPITVYNFESEEYLKVVFTNNPDKFKGKVNFTISQKDLENSTLQLSAAGLIMNYNNLNDYNEMLNAAFMIQEYNIGYPNGLKVLDASPKSRVAVLSNPDDLSFMNYVDILIDDNGDKIGDHEYLEHVLRYVDQSGGPLVMKTFNKDENGNKYPVVVTFSVNKTLSLDEYKGKSM